jgi:hypothetical protein
MKTVAVLLALFTAFGLLNSSTGSENSNAGDKNLFMKSCNRIAYRRYCSKVRKGFHQ